MRVRSSILLILLTISTSAIAHDIELRANGQTIGWTSPRDARDNVTIALSTDEPFETYELRYRPVNGVTNPILLTEADAKAPVSANGRAVFTLPAPASGFMIYNLWKKTRTGSTAQEREAANRELSTLTPTIDTLTAAIAATAAQQRIVKLQQERTKLVEAAGEASHATEIEQIEKRIAGLEKDLDVFVKIPVARSVDAIKEIQTQLRPLRERLAALQAEEATPDPRIEEIDQRIKQLQSDSDLAPLQTRLTEANSRRAALNTILETTDAYTVLKLGIIIAGSARKTIYYNLSGKSVEDTLQLQAVGDVPLLVDGDLIYLVISRQASARVGAFALTVTKQDGTTIDSNPVRPTTDVQLPESAGEFTFSDAYEDVVMPFVRPARGNNILKMTVTTQADVVTVDKTDIIDSGAPKQTKTTQKQAIDLLKDVELPQVHPLYRFNVTTGLAYSGIRQPQFSKVQTAADNPATTEKEDRYRIDTDEGDRKVRPLLALTIYWKPNDPLQRLTLKERLTPNPMIALGFTDPVDNVFAGFSNEFWRGVQVTWGIHRGRIDVLQNRSEVNEDQQMALPPTQKAARQKFFVGVTFNVNFLTKLIKLPSAS